MSVTYGNPIIITSGQLSSPITRSNIKLDRFYWHSPSLASTSSMLLRKGGPAGPVFSTMTCEVSGQSQTIEHNGTWIEEPYIECMPTGTLYIYTK